MKSSSHSGILSLQFPTTLSRYNSRSPFVTSWTKETDTSCGTDVEDVAVVELNDSRGITNGTKFSVLLKFVSRLFCGQTGLATIGPLIRETVLIAKFSKGQCGNNILEQLHSDENMKIMHILFFWEGSTPCWDGHACNVDD